VIKGHFVVHFILSQQCCEAYNDIFLDIWGRMK